MVRVSELEGRYYRAPAELADHLAGCLGSAHIDFKAFQPAFVNTTCYRQSL